MSHFYETREDQSRRALVDAVTRQPDTTMAELAAFVEQHPELSGMTLDELLERVRRGVARQEPRPRALAEWLAGVERTAPGFARIPAEAGWPETHVAGEAARRIRGHEQAIADIITRVTRKAEQLGLDVDRTTIYADKVLGGDGIMVNFRVAPAGDREPCGSTSPRSIPDCPSKSG